MPTASKTPRPSATPRAFDVVLGHIEDGILSGRYPVGSTLPSERDLAERLGVGRASVREAIRAFEAQGVLTSSVGAGATGGTKVCHDRSRALTRLLRLHVALEDSSVEEVVELRVSLERTSATLAAVAVTPALLRSMRAALDAMAAPGVGIEMFNELDTQFHVLLAEAAANSLVTDLTTAVRESLRGPILAAEHELLAEGSYDDFRAALVRQHEGIYAALADHDGDRAADRVEAHIRSAYAILPAMAIARG